MPLTTTQRMKKKLLYLQSCPALWKELTDACAAADRSMMAPSPFKNRNKPPTEAERTEAHKLADAARVTAVEDAVEMLRRLR